MSNNLPENWTQDIWDEINKAVKAEAGKVRISQKVFPTVEFDDNPTQIINDVIDFRNLSIREGDTKPFVEIYQEFPLTSTQVKQEATIKTCKTLARMAAKALALAEDTIIFQGKDGSLPGNVDSTNLASAGAGLLGEAIHDTDDKDPNKVSKPRYVKLADSDKVDYGAGTFSAVTEGLSLLVAKGQAPPYALFLPTRAYADTYSPPGDESLVTTADRIKPLVEGGFYGTGTLPEERGLLVALGGEPTTLFVGREIVTEFVRMEGSEYFFRVVERVQFVARDPRAFVLIEFEPIAGKGQKVNNFAPQELKKV